MVGVGVAAHGVDRGQHLQGMSTRAHGDRRHGDRYNPRMQTPMPKIPWLVMSLVTALAFAAGIGLSAWHNGGKDDPHIDGLMWPDPPTVPALNLVRDDGKAFHLSDLRGKWSLLFFGFTHCPDVCPTTLTTLAQVHTALQNSPTYGRRGQVIFVSVDPQRDTPSQLAAYVHYFHKDFIGVTAEEAALKPLTRALGVLFMKVAQGGEDYSVDHSAGVFFIDPGGRLVSVMTPPHSADALIARFTAVSQFIDGKS
jgi:protein SCO1